MKDNEFIKLIFGFKVKYLRQQQGLSYQQLSKLSSLSVSYLNDIEKGKKYPKVDKISTLAKALGVEYDELVSQKGNKKLQPIIDLVSSDWFKAFPTEAFGIDYYKLFELFSTAPDKVSAFLSSVNTIARNYQMNNEQFFSAVLRAYQDLHNNYFEKVEKAVKDFRKAHQLEGNLKEGDKHFEKILLNKYQVKIDYEKLQSDRETAKIRSYFSEKNRILYINNKLNFSQINFVIGRELCFQFMDLEDRPYITSMMKFKTFENLMSNFYASYFAAALLMPEDQVVEDIHKFSQLSEWDSNVVLSCLKKYNVSPEMYLHRMTNILPHHFQIEDLFFLKMLSKTDLRGYRMTKEIHLNRLHSPYANELSEHYCRRWVAIQILKNLRAVKQVHPDQQMIADAQISSYYQTDNSYLCISMSKPNTFNREEGVSLTIGMRVDEKLMKLFPFINHPQFKNRIVNTTCERCGIFDCEARVYPPVIIEEQQRQSKVRKQLEAL